MIALVWNGIHGGEPSWNRGDALRWIHGGELSRVFGGELSWVFGGELRWIRWLRLLVRSEPSDPQSLPRASCLDRVKSKSHSAAELEPRPTARQFVALRSAARRLDALRLDALRSAAPLDPCSAALRLDALRLDARRLDARRLDASCWAAWSPRVR